MKTQRFVCSPSGVCVHPVGSGEAAERTELLGRGGGEHPGSCPRTAGGAQLCTTSLGENSAARGS